jgi:hypothetical protein
VTTPERQSFLRTPSAEKVIAKRPAVMFNKVTEPGFHAAKKLPHAGGSFLSD